MILGIVVLFVLGLMFFNFDLVDKLISMLFFLDVVEEVVEVDVFVVLVLVDLMVFIVLVVIVSVLVGVVAVSLV